MFYYSIQIKDLKSKCECKYSAKLAHFIFCYTYNNETIGIRFYLLMDSLTFEVK